MPPRRRRRSKHQETAESPLRKSLPPVAIDPWNLTARLRKLHEDAGDPDVERMPEASDIDGVLLYCERHASALSGKAAKEAALLCVHLYEYTGDQQKIHQSRAAYRAHDAGATWGEIAGPMRVNSPSGAYQRAVRGEAVDLSYQQGVGPVRRTPQAVNKIKRELAEAERQRRLRKFTAEERSEDWEVQAKKLLRIRKSLVRDAAGMVSFWLEQIEYDLNDEEALARATMHNVQSLMRTLDIAAKSFDGKATTSEEAQEVLQSVRKFIEKEEDDL